MHFPTVRKFMSLWTMGMQHREYIYNITKPNQPKSAFHASDKLPHSYLYGRAHTNIFLWLSRYSATSITKNNKSHHHLLDQIIYFFIQQMSHIWMTTFRLKIYLFTLPIIYIYNIFFFFLMMTVNETCASITKQLY